MKKVLLLLFALLGILFNPSIVRAEEMLSDIMQRLESDVSFHDDFITSLEVDDYSSIQRQIAATKAHFNESVAFYSNKVASTEDEQLRGILISLRDSVKGMGDSLTALETSIMLEDEQGIEQALTTYDLYLNQFNSSVDAINNYYGLVDTSDYELMLGWSLAISFLISAFLFVISRGHPLLPAEQLRNEFEAELFKSSLWPLGGSAVSYIWVLATPPGGTFYVFWGPIVFGYFYFAKGLYEYVRFARPAISLAKREQSEKLQGLLASDEFRKEGIVDMARDIENLEPSPVPKTEGQGSR